MVGMAKDHIVIAGVRISVGDKENQDAGGSSGSDDIRKLAVRKEAMWLKKSLPAFWRSIEGQLRPTRQGLLMEANLAQQR
jgi:hypothetical protein